MASYLVTGANRGLGLLMVSCLLSHASSEVGCVVASVRNSSEALEKLASDSGGRLVVLKVQITNEDSVRQFAQHVAKILPNGLDILINNAGMMSYSANAEVGIETMDNLQEHFDINVNGVHIVSKALLPLLRQGGKKVIVNVSSTMGSITRAREFMFQPSPAYKISKASLNMMTVQYAVYLEKEGFTVFCINPGWARTRMGALRADLDPQEAAESMLKKVMAATKDDSGKFFEANVPSWEYKGGPNRYDGEILPW